MTDARYTHGHHDSVLRSHRWRTGENSAGYLLAYLQPGRSLLDVGCGPGTITIDLARRVAPGRVVGIDAAAAVVTMARDASVDAGLPSLSFEVGDAFHLPFEDGAFDVVHAHQVLQHLGDPVAALREMRRVCRPGGQVAARDSDYPVMTFFPDDPELQRALAAYGRLTRVNGANWDAGRRLLHWAHRAGFTEVVASASAWCFATPEDRGWWGGLWADRFTQSALAEQLLGHRIATDEDLVSFAAAWRRWASSPDGWFAVLHGEVVATA
ncbi:MAG: methyltransferase domain-containing protein [Acidimicrobiales bacterium]|jgi:SAM-dependent methyltransferase